MPGWGSGQAAAVAAVTKGFLFLPGPRRTHGSLSPSSISGCQEAPAKPTEQSRAGEHPAPQCTLGWPREGTPEGWKQPRDMAAPLIPSVPSPFEAVPCPEKHFLLRGVQQLLQLSYPQNLTLYPRDTQCI